MPSPKPEEKEAIAPKVSSSSSEFVFNPDPNFLAKINANIRNNNENVDEDGRLIQ